MKKTLLISVSLSLLMPLLVLFVGRSISQLMILLFWPSSIFLLSLGAEGSSGLEIIYVWSAAIAVNMIVYSLLGIVVLLLAKVVKNQ